MIELLENSGIEMESLVLLLLFPVAATFIGLARHIIGFKSLGIYLSLLMTFLLFELGSTIQSIYSDPWRGIKYGFVLFSLIFTFTFLAYKLTKHWALHYYPKLAIIITIVTLLLLVTIITLSLLNIKGILSLNIFTLILVVGLSEKFISILTRKKIKPTLILTLESAFQATICYLIISYQPLTDFLIQYPYVIILIFPINYLIGSFTGLRITEYYRFRKILNDVE